uniref:MENTAL domain-containing protein n=1 Tax=Meloidogyne floridensis TaxID=298350 RepID=A0A915NGV6_9BILA
MSGSLRDRILTINPSIGNILYNPTAYLLYNREIGMSKERRRFLIVNVFDFVLSTLLWLLSAVTKPYKNTWMEVFLEEINIFAPHFLHNSLFDLAILSFLRMLVLLFAYAWIKCDHWIPVAFTTTVSTIFIGIKIFYFFDKDKGSIQQYLVIIASLCIAWFELWLVPFRVLDSEHQRDIGVGTTVINGSDTDRQRLNAQELIRQIVANEEEFFHTAFEDDTSGCNILIKNHLDENEERCKNISRIGKVSRRKCKEAIIRAQNEADSLFVNINCWKVLQKENKNVPEIRYHDASNSYYIKTVIDHTARAVFNAVWRENQKWNKQILETRIVADIVITITKASGGGYIAPSRFITNTEETSFVGVYVSIEFAEEDGTVGGEQKTSKITKNEGGVEIRISKLGEKSALFEWLMNTDLRIPIPRMLIRRSITSFVMDYTKMLVTFLDENPTGIK